MHNCPEQQARSLKEMAISGSNACEGTSFFSVVRWNIVKDLALQGGSTRSSETRQEYSTFEFLGRFRRLSMHFNPLRS